jgi:starvation-inducible DNA-binding protein
LRRSTTVDRNLSLNAKLMRRRNTFPGEAKMSKVKAFPGAAKGQAALATPTDLPAKGVEAIAAALNGLVADTFTLYLKTKNFHWHMSGPHFRDYHLLLDEQATQIYATIDPLAERVRKLGQMTLRSVGNVARLARIKDNDKDFVPPQQMLQELLSDNRTVASSLREAHEICDDNKDVATASILEIYIDEAERRAWFLFEATRSSDENVG